LAPARVASSARAEFDAAFARWLPRVHRFAERRAVSRAEAEAITKRTLVAAAARGLLLAGDEAAGEILRLAKAEIARARRGAGVDA
jgi:DNA-directed RNA polymerase specialized sigma24 family protein